MITCEDFKDTNGKINWDAYLKAQREEREQEIAAGKYCYQCRQWIFTTFGNRVPGKRLCDECSDLISKKEPQHHCYARCPHCMLHFNAFENFDCMEDGEHDVECPSCAKDFTIETHVSYKFTSKKSRD